MTEIKRHFWKELPLFNFVEFFLTSNVKWVVKGVLCKHNQSVSRHLEYKRAEKVTVSTYFPFINRPSIYCFDLITPKLITLFGFQFKIKSSDRIFSWWHAQRKNVSEWSRNLSTTYMALLWYVLQVTFWSFFIRFIYEKQPKPYFHNLIITGHQAS